MVSDLLHALGGLGLFILGMIIMTEGLRGLAGEALGRWLYRFTRSPLSGAVSGAAVTALVQSSSATAVATVGFVTAGLMTFPQALGILFGANIGTTLTGWLVALLGFKLEIGRLMLPVLLVGVLLRLLGRFRARSVGWALAGFAVIFLGIDQLRAGLARFEGVVTPADFPPDSWGGRLLLVLIGVGITLVTQSSSAGVAVALGAIGVGAISFQQAAAMVIGMDVGTTSTAVLATIGGGVQTRRTGYSHLVYNVLTGAGALLILDAYASFVDVLAPGTIAGRPMLALVGFHTTFNTLGVVLVLPFAGRFAHLMERLVPQHDPVLTRRLESSLLRDATAATVALLGALRELAAETFSLLAARLPVDGEASSRGQRLVEIDRAVGEARRYSDLIQIAHGEREARDRLLAAMHCLDHLERLLDRCRQEERLATVAEDDQLEEAALVLRHALESAAAGLEDPAEPSGEAALDSAWRQLRDVQEPYRSRVLEEVPAGELELDDAIRRLDSIRWLHRTAYHAWRIVHHLRAPLSPSGSSRGVAPGDRPGAARRGETSR